MNKILTIAALALVLSACSNEDNDIQTPVEQPAKSEGIPFTATISIGENAMTRALTEDATNNQIVPTWAAGEKVALIHNGVNDEMSVASVSGGVATITGTITGSPTTGDAVTIIYPSTAADGTTGNVKANLLAAQDGTLATIAANYDVRKGTGTLKVSGTASLNGNVSLTNQFAIWKLTLGNDAKNLCIMADNVPIAGATLASAGKEFTVAIPAVSSKKNVTITIVANDESNNCYYFSEYGVKIAAGKYYQSSPTMKTLGTSDSESVYKITGDASAIIPDDKTVVLSGVNITNGSITCFDDATIILMGTNSIKATTGHAAILVGFTGITLTITGTGELTATGGNFGAGIGTNGADGTTLSGGNIVINGGRVNATGGATAAGIGTGRANSSSSGNASQTCGTITINGGTVTATGGAAAAGIGTGYVDRGSNKCGDITIGTGVTSVIATKGSNCFNNIGPGYTSTPLTQHCGKITFGTKQVFDGGTDLLFRIEAGTYGGLNLAISTTTNTNDTWTLTPAP